MSERAADLSAIWREFAATRDLGLRNQLVEAHLELARTIAAMLYRHRGTLEVEFGDYLQFATLGLIEAVDRFDVGRGVAFASFASIRMRGAVLNSLSALSEEYQQIDLRKRLRLDRVESLRRPETGGRDLFARLADMAVGLALSQLLEGSGMLQGEGDTTATYQQQFYDSTRERQLRETLERVVKSLPEQERRVIRYHYFQNIGFGDVAELLGVTKGRVSQIHRRALQLLRQAQVAAPTLSREL
jgi:RNA polymerase sigma factor for flagellar operon FliA